MDGRGSETDSAQVDPKATRERCLETAPIFPPYALKHIAAYGTETNTATRLYLYYTKLS